MFHLIRDIFINKHKRNFYSINIINISSLQKCFNLAYSPPTIFVNWDSQMNSCVLFLCGEISRYSCAVIIRYCFLQITVHLLCLLHLGQLQEEAANRRDKLDPLKQPNERASTRFNLTHRNNEGEFTKKESCPYDEGFLGIGHENEQSSSIGNVPRSPSTISCVHQHFRGLKNNV
jgi:hypothetical protein